MRLITFGDSWTAGLGIESESKFKHQSAPREGDNFIIKQRWMNAWPRYLAEKLDCQYINCAYCAFSNEDMLTMASWVLRDNLFEEGDIAIVMFTYPYRRGMLPLETYNKLEEVLANVKHFYFNSFYKTFHHVEGLDLNSLANFINPDECVSDVLREYERANDVSVWEYGSRTVYEGNEVAFDQGYYHPNLLGYKLIADYVYENIKDKI